MTAPVRTAEEMREAAARLVLMMSHHRDCPTDCYSRMVACEVMDAIRALPVAEGPTVLQAVKAYSRAVGETHYPPTHIDGLRAVLALCGGETRERWASWEEAHNAVIDAFETHHGGRSTWEGACLEAARAVLAKAPPEGTP